jgi:hypothetical protein
MSVAFWEYHHVEKLSPHQLFFYPRGHRKLVRHLFSLHVSLKQDPSKCWVTFYQTTQHCIPEDCS